LRFLYTLDELLAIDTNAWSCHECGKTYADVTDGLAVVVVESSDPECLHPVLNRAVVNRTERPR
jgi:hypothetical protein